MSDCTCRSHGSFLTAKGLEEAAQRELLLAEVDAMAPLQYLDSRVSVSGLELERDLYEIQSSDQLLEQCERFHNGS